MPVSFRCSDLSSSWSDGHATTGFFLLCHVVADVDGLQIFDCLQCKVYIVFTFIKLNMDIPPESALPAFNAMAA